MLPGHGEPFRGLPERTAELLAHHQRRLEESLQLLLRRARRRLRLRDRGARCAGDRHKTWDDLSGFERRMAVTETLAHVELLHSRGQVTKTHDRGVIRYSIDPAV